MGAVMATVIPGVAFAAGDMVKGKSIFAAQCVSCHGDAGKGDGVAAVALSPKPRNLADKAYMGGLTDQRIADAIKKGGAGVGKSPLMPAFDTTLNDNDIGDVVAFVRTLAK